MLLSGLLRNPPRLAKFLMKTMSRSPANATATEAEVLRNENNLLKERLANLREAGIGVSGSLDTEEVLQDVIYRARELTCARYGALLTFEPSGGVRDFYTCGLSQEERELITQSPRGLGLLGYMSRAKDPVRLKDMATHPDAVGFPENHPPHEDFTGNADLPSKRIRRQPISHGKGRRTGVYTGR